MTNTKLCSECRHKRMTAAKQDPLLCGLTVTTLDRGTPYQRMFAMLCEAERLNSSGCGATGKHFEPIGGADGQD